jgi:Sec-independent protein translocase protein TatA
MPEIARQVGRFLNEFRRASYEFRSQIESEINALDVGGPKQQILPPLQAPLGSLANRIFNPPSSEKSAEMPTEKLEAAGPAAVGNTAAVEAATVPSADPYPASKAAPDA